MFIQVRLLKGFSKLLTYKIPSNISTKNLVGKLVIVPIKNQTISAIVIRQLAQIPENQSFIIKEIKCIESFPEDINYHKLLNTLGRYYQTDHVLFFKRIKHFLSETHTKQQSHKMSSITYQTIHNTSNQCTSEAIMLTDEQQYVVNFLSEKIINPVYQPTVLHGVTGSGKTEIYKKLIEMTLNQKKTSILLLPEVTLAIQFERILQQQLPKNIFICGFHSAITLAHKKKIWQYLIEKKPMLIIGVHLPIFLPIANLGSIIVDEEHEDGYQEKKHPKINSKYAAILRAKIYRIPILMGSATPSLSSLYNVKENNWKFFQLKKRFSGNFPEIKTVFLNDKKYRRNFWISKPLEDAIADRLEQKKQTIIFLNRRGFSFFVQCKNCNFIFSCPNCSVSLTLHQNSILNCHYCSFEIKQPQFCPTCKEKQFIQKGIGTQQVVALLEQLFPHANIGRADIDITSKKKLWQQTMKDFENGSLDILVGTKTITKGFHFPRVTLVGILWADLNLHFPIFNASETTLQQLIQVAGRAGRSSEKSEVIVQAMGKHSIFNFLNEVDYLKFYADEIEKRKDLGYPPYKRLIEIELKHHNENTVEKEAIILACLFIELVKQKNFPIQVLGPSRPPVAKIKQIYIRKVYLKGGNINLMIDLFHQIQISSYVSSIFFTPNPSH